MGGSWPHLKAGSEFAVNAGYERTNLNAMAQNIVSPPMGDHGVDDAIARVRAYHQRTKHTPERFAPGPGYMDWANQPDPFRRFAGARMVELRRFATTARRNMTRCTVPGKILATCRCNSRPCSNLSSTSRGQRRLG